MSFIKLVSMGMLLPFSRRIVRFTAHTRFYSFDKNFEVKDFISDGLRPLTYSELNKLSEAVAAEKSKRGEPVPDDKLHRYFKKFGRLQLFSYRFELEDYNELCHCDSSVSTYHFDLKEEIERHPTNHGIVRKLTAKIGPMKIETTFPFLKDRTQVTGASDLFNPLDSIYDKEAIVWLLKDFLHAHPRIVTVMNAVVGDKLFYMYRDQAMDKEDGEYVESLDADYVHYSLHGDEVKDSFGDDVNDDDADDVVPLVGADVVAAS